jgi:hypothetical protein
MNKIFGLFLLIIFSPVLNPLAMADDSKFNLIYDDGVNKLDTFNGTLTREWHHPQITIKFSLSKQELDSIYDKMIEINFFAYPSKIQGMLVHPGQWHYFKVESSNGIKEVSCDGPLDFPGIKDTKILNLQKVVFLINSILYSKDEVKKLPMGPLAL